MVDAGDDETDFLVSNTPKPNSNMLNPQRIGGLG